MSIYRRNQLGIKILLHIAPSTFPGKSSTSVSYQGFVTRLTLATFADVWSISGFVAHLSPN